MTREGIDALLAATWPPVSTRALGPWTLRSGGGGGKRVSAASTRAPVTGDDIARAERAMLDEDRQPLFAVFAGQHDLDRHLTERAYHTLDPTLLFDAPIGAQTGGTTPGARAVHDVRTMSAQKLHDVPTEGAQAVHDVPTSGARAVYVPCTQAAPSDDARAIWAAGGIGPARLAVMDRVTAPKTTLLLRREGTPVAAAFVALHGRTAMLHALDVAAEHRRQGAGRAAFFATTAWAAGQGADRIALLVTRANAPAIALYRDLGMTGRACYHYRIRP